jgi:hypothetical protein
MQSSGTVRIDSAGLPIKHSIPALSVHAAQFELDTVSEPARIFTNTYRAPIALICRRGTCAITNIHSCTVTYAADLSQGHCNPVSPIMCCFSYKAHQPYAASI